MAKKLINTHVKLGENTILQEAVLPLMLPFILTDRGYVSDLDTATETGIYRYSTTGILIVFKQNSDYISQVIFHWNSIYLYMRTRWNGSWSNLRRVALSEF